MRLKSAAVLALFLCFAFFFRMFYLSFGQVPATSYHSTLSYKRKFAPQGHSLITNIKAETWPSQYTFSKAKLKPSKKGILIRKLKFAPFILLAVLFSLLTIVFSGFEPFRFVMSRYRFPATRRHLSLSVIRV